MRYLYFAERLSEKNSIHHYDLDDVFWDNTADHYGTKMPVERRTELFNRILSEDDWIIEGVFFDWLNDSFEQADKIFIMETPIIISRYRIIRRFFRRKLGHEKGKKETLKSLIELLKWTERFQNMNMPKIRSLLQKYNEKVIVLRNPKEIRNYI